MIMTGLLFQKKKDIRLDAPNLAFIEDIAKSTENTDIAQDISVDHKGNYAIFFRLCYPDVEDLRLNKGLPHKLIATIFPAEGYFKKSFKLSTPEKVTLEILFMQKGMSKGGTV